MRVNSTTIPINIIRYLFTLFNSSKGREIHIHIRYTFHYSHQHIYKLDITLASQPTENVLQFYGGRYESAEGTTQRYDEIPRACERL